MYTKTLLAALLAVSAGASQAALTGAAGGDTDGPFLDLTALPAGITLTGGALYNTDLGTADIPTNVDNGWNTVGSFLAVGPSHGDSATMSFATGMWSLSFLWGSPDIRNQLTVTTNAGEYSFTAAGLGILPVPEGDQSKAQYVSFNTTGNEYIVSLSFTNTSDIDAFEASNFAAAVPEPETYALMMAGLLAVGYMSRRRQG